MLGASKGLGFGIAQGLAEEGARVAIASRTIEGSKAAADKIGRDVLPFICDTGKVDQVDTLAKDVVEAFGGVDILVLNGGGPPPAQAQDMTADDIDGATGLLLRPHVEMVRAVLPAMREQRWGRIVAIGSTGVQQPIPTLAASNVGRAALAGYLKSLSGDVAGDGVTVNMVLPGRIDTERVVSIDTATAERNGITPEEARRESESSIPIGRYGSPEEFAAVVAFLAGDKASYVTGEQVRCDGGLVRAH